jgi:hypothetical protein
MDWCGGEPKHKAREGSKEGLENELHYANPALAQGADAFLRLEQTKGRGGAPLEARLREAIEVNLRTLASTYPPSPSQYCPKLLLCFFSFLFFLFFLFFSFWSFSSGLTHCGRSGHEVYHGTMLPARDGVCG